MLRKLDALGEACGFLLFEDSWLAHCMSSRESKNYYEILGVSYDATTEEIKEAYREVARVYHPDSRFYDEIVPDRAIAAEDERLFQRVTDAYTTLVNPDRRASYDRMLNALRAGWSEEEFAAEESRRYDEGTEALRRKRQTLSFKRTVFGDTTPESSERDRLPTQSHSISELMQRRTSPWTRRITIFVVIVCSGFLSGTIFSLFLRALREH